MNLSWSKNGWKKVQGRTCNYCTTSCYHVYFPQLMFFRISFLLLDALCVQVQYTVEKYKPLQPNDDWQNTEVFTQTECNQMARQIFIRLSYPRIRQSCCQRTGSNPVQYTDKKENLIFLIYREIQSGAVAKSYMRKGFLIYMWKFAKISPYMRGRFVIYDFATAPL